MVLWQWEGKEMTPTEPRGIPPRIPYWDGERSNRCVSTSSMVEQMRWIHKALHEIRFVDSKYSFKIDSVCNEIEREWPEVLK